MLFARANGSRWASPSLQKELTAFGAAAFEVNVLEELAEPQPGHQVEQLLLALKLRWQEQLQPFGERGYDSLKQFERERGQLSGDQA